MTYKAVNREEFVIEGDQVTHKPTGAWFSAYKGQREISHISWEHAGWVLSNWDEYRPDEIREMGALLLKDRKIG